MPLHKNFKRGTHIIVFFKDGMKLDGKFEDSVTEYLFLKKYRDIHKISWSKIRATAIYKNKDEETTIL